MGMKIIHIGVIDKILISYPATHVLNYLWDIKNLADYEPKVDRILLNATKNTYEVTHGHFAGIPWKGNFSYKKTDDGFISEILNRPLGIFVKGGFQVKEKQGATEVQHFESYNFPIWALPAKPLIRMYLKWAMKKELRNISNGVAHSISS